MTMTPTAPAEGPRVRRQPRRGRSLGGALSPAWCRGILSAALAVGALAVGALSACALGTATGAGMTVMLIVENRAYHDVNVYAVRNEGARGTRLGTVIGNTTTTFRVRENDLQPGGIMVLQVRAIGGRSTWTTPGLLVGTGSIAKLDVVATGTTDLSQSQFYLRQ